MEEPKKQPFQGKDRRPNNRPFNKNKRPYNNIKTTPKQILEETMKNTSETVKDHVGVDFTKYSGKKYNNFVENAKKKTPVNIKIIKYLPNVLLSLSILASNNRDVIKPVIQTYLNVRQKLKDPMGFAGIVSLIVSEYGKIVYNMPIFDSVFMGFSALSLFLEDIPSIIKNVKPVGKDDKGLQFTIMTRVIKNLKDVKRDVFDTPLKTLELEKNIKDAKDKLQAMYQTLEKKGKMSVNGETQEINIPEMRKMLSSIENTHKQSTKQLQSLSNKPSNKPQQPQKQQQQPQQQNKKGLTKNQKKKQRQKQNKSQQ